MRFNFWWRMDVEDTAPVRERGYEMAPAHNAQTDARKVLDDCAAAV